MLEAGRITNQQMAAIRKETAATAQSIRTLNTVAGGFVGLQGLKAAATQLASIADGYSNVQAKIRLAAGENANLSASFDRVFGVAQRTYNSLDGTAALVQRGAQALRSFGLEADAAFSRSVELAEVFNKGLVISGASASEAANAALQFSQALASGRFQGDEFRSVMENNSRFAKLLADSLGVNIAQLREMSKEGKLTTQTFLNLLNRTQELDAEFNRMPLTIGRAKAQLDNAFTRFIGEADQARGTSRAIAQAMSALANNLGPVVTALGNLAIVAAGAFGARLILSAKAYATSLLEQAAAAKAAAVTAKEKAVADQQAAQATLLKARGEQVAAEQAVAAAAADRSRIQSVIAMARAQEAAIRANALRAKSEIELARLSQQLTAVEGARAAATKALGDARAAEIRANAQLLVANRALKDAYAATGAAGASSMAKITLGMRAATAAQNAMTLATRAFSSALALVGGPLGLVIIGVGLLASGFANAGARAQEAEGKFRAAIEAAGAFRDFQTKEAALSALGSLHPERAQEIAEIERLRRIRGQGPLPSYNTGSVLSPNFQTGATIDKEIAERTRRVTELSREIDYINKRINENTISWSNNGQALQGASSESEEHNKALEKQLRSATAQRLEIEKGIKAALEYEAMQELGVKSVSELSEATRAKIDALAKEKEALKAAQEARKGATKAEREAESATSRRAEQYTSIVDRINRQIALDRESQLVTDEMTAAQKLQVVVLEDLKSAKNLLTDAEKARVRALLDEAVAQGLAAKNMEDARQGAEELLRLQNQLNESLRTQQAQNDADLFGIGRGEEATERMRRLVDIQREYQRQVESLNLQLAAAGGDKATDAAKAAYQAQLDALNTYHEQALRAEEDYQRRRTEMQANGWNGIIAATEDYIARAADVAGQARDITGSFLEGLTDNFTEFFTKGRADWKSFFDDINAEILRFIVRQQLSNFMKSLMGGGATASANGGGWAGALWSLFGGGSGGWGWADGGYTGPGGKYEPAGIVHKGEGVLTQAEVASLGGVAGFNALRQALRRGYADGGLAGGSSRVAVGARIDSGPANPRRAAGAGFTQIINNTYAGREDRRTAEYAAAESGRQARRAMSRAGG